MVVVFSFKKERENVSQYYDRECNSDYRSKIEKQKCYLESKSDDNTKQPSVTLH